MKSFLTLMAILCFVSFSATAQPRKKLKPPETADSMFLKITAEVPEFGGFWYEGKRLVIGLTNLTASARAKASTIALAVLKKRPNEVGRIKFKKVDNSFSTIHSARTQIKKLFKRAKLTFLDTDERSNVVRVGIADLANEPRLREEIRKFGIADKLYKIEQRQVATPDVADLLNLSKRVRPLMGGIAITRTNAAVTEAVGSCTLGIVARLNGIRGFLSNSHCTRIIGQVDGTIFAQYDTALTFPPTNPQPVPADRIGQETADSPLFTSSDTDDCSDDEQCIYADAAFFTLDDTVTAYRGRVLSPSTTSIDNFNWEVVGVVPIGVDGMRLVRVGKTTGVKTGEVNGTCSDYAMTDGVVRLCSDSLDISGSSGDSGAPLLAGTDQPGKVLFYGLHFGSTTYLFGDKDGLISPYYLIVSQLGALEVRSGNDPPTINITSPLNNSTIGMNALSKVKFEAEIFDPEGKQCGAVTSNCTVTWTSNVDGVLGTGRDEEFAFTTAGPRTITATVKDGNNTVTDQVAINISTSAPNITIVEPSGPIYLGVNYILYAKATDSDIALLVPLPCNRLTWNSNNAADRAPNRLPKNGCEIIHTFNTLGPRTLSVKARDSQGDEGTQTISVNVLPRPATGPPIVSLLITDRIIGKKPNDVYQLRASIWDPEGVDPISYKWIIKYGTTEKVIVNKSRASRVQISDDWRPADHVPSTCGGWPAKLTLEVRDPQGMVTTKSVDLHIVYPLC